jgi:hypothetical protein
MIGPTGRSFVRSFVACPGSTGEIEDVLNAFLHCLQYADYYYTKNSSFFAAAHVFHETRFTVGFVGGYTLHCDLMSLSHAFIMIHGLP